MAINSRCKGRKSATCKRSKRRCLWATGSKRSFCRKRRTSRYNAKCKGRKSATCRLAKRRCLWASGSKRAFCRKRRTRRH